MCNKDSIKVVLHSRSEKAVKFNIKSITSVSTARYNEIITNRNIKHFLHKPQTHRKQFQEVCC